ncbi:DNA cross-link repair protein PSO2/SNM1 [Malassezia japonica]|uniref:DNA cross-link repair protein PSO2/SNM1 n=1 Tax=Malassezia japonica TaxID=223818 RepID=A0AAF0JAZ9_9BASI|nr:DNA cross-link repair protein PSO2/SNM1 [Malassezia japonica]WFD40377.1 DNA cross-link repair protein PSO2/SNM1 [Malassezia japonica]
MPPRKRAREPALCQTPLAPFLAEGSSPSKRVARSEDAELEAALAASLEEAERHVPCPLCGVAFPAEAIQRHASACADAVEDTGDASVAFEVAEAMGGRRELFLGIDEASDGDVDKAEAEPCEERSNEPSEEQHEPKATIKAEDGDIYSAVDTDTKVIQARLSSADVKDIRAAELAPGPWNAPRAKAGKKRSVPFYKVLEGMPISVDAFSFGSIAGCTAYVLTHFHSDHYGGLSGRWEHGPIYCSAITARLVRCKLHVDEKWLRPLPMDTPTLLPDTGGVHVTCIDANHCPGACIMLFEGKQTAHILPGPRRSMHIGSARIFRYLHCGDFRACPAQVQHKALDRPVDIVYLDTTYLNPRYCFPAQPQVIEACTALVTSLALGQAPQARQTTLPWNAPRLSLMAQWLGRSDHAPQPGQCAVLVVVGTYSIGKENLVVALARALRTSIYCVDARKYETYAQLQDASLDALLTRDPLCARVHVTNLFSLSPAALRGWSDSLRTKGMSISHTLAFRPTGWAYRGSDRGVIPDTPLEKLLPLVVPRPFGIDALVPTRDSTSETQVYSVPYSEHSSFYELLAFLVSLPHHRVIPTVNVGSEASRNKMRRWTDVWTRAAQRHAEHPLVEARSDLYW